MKSAFELNQVEKFKKFPQSSGVVLGPGDDAAVLSGCRKDEQLVFCGDMLIEGVHFDLKQATLKDVGYKAVARTLSDIAAMGGEPRYMGFSLALPRSRRRRIDEIVDGARMLLDSFGVSMVGGDLSSSDRIMCDTWAIGTVRKDRFFKRSDARAGHKLFVTGPLGGSYESKRHLKFIPRIEQGRWLAKNIPVGGMLDISDGLVLDLYRMLAESGVGAVLHEEALPFNPGCKLNNALYDGEDYELLFSAPALYAQKLQRHGFIQIGEVCAQKQVMLKTVKGRMRSLRVRGFSSLS